MQRSLADNFNLLVVLTGMSSDYQNQKSTTDILTKLCGDPSLKKTKINVSGVRGTVCTKFHCNRLKHYRDVSVLIKLTDRQTLVKVKQSKKHKRIDDQTGF